MRFVCGHRSQFYAPGGSFAQQSLHGAHASAGLLPDASGPRRGLTRSLPSLPELPPAEPTPEELLAAYSRMDR